MDLVQVYAVEATQLLNEKAEVFLYDALDEYAIQEGLYKSLKYDDDICDTGFIENGIVKQLSAELKQAYRVTKCIISQLSYHITINGLKALSKGNKVKLYGRKPWISSYQLRVLFLHLLINVHGTKVEQRLKGGLFVLRLLDMLEKCREQARHIDDHIYIYIYIYIYMYISSILQTGSVCF